MKINLYTIKMFVLLLGMLILITACSANIAASSIEIVDPWIRTTGMSGHNQSGQGQAMGNNSAAYMRIDNKSDSADKLIRVEGEVAENIELHRSEMKDGVMTMNPVEYIEVPANGSVELKPGGLHIMLIGVTSELESGNQIQLDLFFEEYGKMSIKADVKSP